MSDNIIKRQIYLDNLEEEIEGSRQELIIRISKVLVMMKEEDKKEQRTIYIGCILILLMFLVLSFSLFLL